MNTYLMTNQDFNAAAKVFAGQAFHRPHGTEHREIKFVHSKAQRDILAILSANNIDIAEKEKTVN